MPKNMFPATPETPKMASRFANSPSVSVQRTPVSERTENEKDSNDIHQLKIKDTRPGHES